MTEENLPHISEAFKNCPNCRSTDISIGDDRSSFHCGQCSFTLFFGPALNVSVILRNKQGQIMLSWRKQEPKTECWEINGGFGEYGETQKEIGIRNLRRELGNGFDVTELLKVTERSMMYPYGGYLRPTLCIYFVADITEGYPASSGEVGHVNFFEPKEIPWNLIGHETDKWALKQLLPYALQPAD